MLQHIKNLRGVPSTPHPLYHGGGKTLRVCPRVSVLDLRKVKVTSVGSKDSKRRNFSSKGGRAHTGTIFSQTSSKQSTSFDFWVEQKNVGVFMPKHLERIWPVSRLSFLTCPKWSNKHSGRLFNLKGSREDRRRLEDNSPFYNFKTAHDMASTK